MSTSGGGTGTAEPVALAGHLRCPRRALSELSQALLRATKLHPAAIILSIKEGKNTSSASNLAADGVTVVAQALTPTQLSSSGGLCSVLSAKGICRSLYIPSGLNGSLSWGIQSLAVADLDASLCSQLAEQAFEVSSSISRVIVINL